MKPISRHFSKAKALRGGFTGVVFSLLLLFFPAELSAQLNTNCTFNATISATDNQCSGSGDGTAAVTVNGGIGPFSYNWSGPGGFTSTNDAVNSLVSGSYSCTITDAINCSEVLTVTVGQIQDTTPPVLLNVPADQFVDCDQPLPADPVTAFDNCEVTLFVENLVGPNECEPGLRGWWPAEGNGIDVQDSLNAALINGTTFSGGIAGQAFSFDGVDDYLETGATNFAANSYSVVVWINTSDTTGTQAIFAATDTLNGNPGATVTMDSTGRVSFLHRPNFGTTGGTTITSGPGFNDGNWHQITAIMGDTVQRLLVDNVGQGSAINYGNINAPTKLTIGRISFLAQGDNQNFNGLLDENRVYARALCNPEIQALYLAGIQNNTWAPTFTLRRVYTAFDNSGNFTQADYNITVQDTTPPNLTVPAPLTVQCVANGGIRRNRAVVRNWINSANSEDDCTCTVLTHNSPSFFPSNCQQGNIYTITWTAVDGCGNTISKSSTLTVVDTVGPNMTCPTVTVQTDPDSCTGAFANFAISAFDACQSMNTPITYSVQPGSFFALGTTAVTATSEDNCGNSASCTFQVTVADQTPPTITCPANLQLFTDVNNCSANANWIAPVAVDACGIASLTSTAMLGSSFPVGSTNVTYTALDVNGNVASCTFQVTVTDTIDPVITCPANITVFADSNSCSANVSYATPTATDACGIASILSQQGTGSFAVGVTTVGFTALDVNGNSSTCSFTVTVIDSTAPAITCPADFTVSTDSNSCSATLNLPAANASDACGIANVASSISGGATLQLGATTVTFTATDDNNNTSSCTTTVTVVDDVAPVVACQNVTVQLAANGTASVSAANLVANSFDNCGIANIDPAITNFTCADVGPNQVTVTVTDSSNNSSSCVATVTVEDNVAPTIQCPSDLQVACAADVPAADPNTAIASDNCPGVVITHTSDVDNGGAGCANDPLIITRTYTATDASNNTATCTQTITVVDDVAPVISCPADVTLACGADTSPMNTGMATATDNCVGGGSGGCGQAISYPLATTSGATMIDYCGFFPCNGPQPNWGTATLNQTATDLSITFSMNQTIGSQWFVESATYKADAAANFTLTAGGVPVPDASWTMRTASGIPATYTITIPNSQLPSTPCYALGVSISAVQKNFLGAVDNASRRELWVYATSSPNTEFLPEYCTQPCNGGNGVTITSSDAFVNSCGSMGTITRTWTATDACGNSSSCDQLITIQDTVAPMLTCPADISVNNAPGLCAATVTFAATATDACTNVNLSYSHAPGSSFPVGTTTVTVTATDACSNVSTCTFDVTVTDTEAPIAVCQDITVQLDANGNASITASDVDGGSTDNCGIATVEICNGNPAPTVTCSTIDFGGFAAGTNITNQLANQGITSVTASGGIGQAWIFNSGSPTGGDYDLGTPNQQFNGPGIGNGGASNNVALGNLLIIQEHGGSPDDNVSGGNLDFTFASARTVVSVTVIDIEASNDYIELLTTTGVVTVAIPSTGNNGVVEVPVNTDNVISMRVHFSGSGAVAELETCALSSGACGSYDCDDLGDNQVTLTVTDVNGNVSTCTANVTVEDGSFIAITCPDDIVVACEGNGGAVVTWNDPVVNAYSNCSNNTACAGDPNIQGFIYLGERDGHRYYCSNSSNFSWNQANAAAQAAGGELVTINNASENAFLTNAIQASFVWIGLNDENTEGQFEWSSNEAVSYTNWQSGDPNNAGGTCCPGQSGADYTVLRRSTGTWYDRGGCGQHEFIMEIPCGSGYTLQQVAGPSSGDFIPSGTATVTYIAFNATDTATCSFDVTVGECAPDYCNASANCSAYEWIRKVRLGDINKWSGNDGGYADYTAYSTTLQAGGTANITLKPGFAGNSYREYWRVYIDWNRDGDFYDAGERVYQGNGTSTKYGTINVPANAANGPLRMRVMMRWDQYPGGPCCTYYYGEVEDYTVYVNGSNSRVIAGNATEQNTEMAPEMVESTPSSGFEFSTVYPNPVSPLVSDEVTLAFRSGAPEEVSLKVMDLTGRVLSQRNFEVLQGANRCSVDVSRLAAGTYLIEIKGAAGSRTEKLVVQ